MSKGPGLALLATVWLWALPGSAALSPEQEAFVAELSQRHGFEAPYLREFLNQARHDNRIIDAISRPAESLPWYRYRSIFLTDDRVGGGVEYWHAHKDTLRAAEAAFGIPPQVITAIIGVETKYGKFTGKHRVADALKTLGFGYPKRATFFRKELEEFLLMTREEGMDPLQPKGSYAGAMGKPQFIASSFRAYAVDFDGDGRRDLWHSDADAIGSVANYLREHRWRTGEPVATRLQGNTAALTPLSSTAASKPDRTLTDIERAGGAFTDQSLDTDQEVVVIRLEQKDGDEFWAGFDNFYVITRYNHSNLYAMAVYQLSEAILEGYNATYGKKDS